MFTVKSKIIKYKHTQIISKWIDRLDDMISPYEFKLLYRGSRDGLGRDNFHKICDYHSQTVTIVKVKNSEEIIGGYNPVEWKSYGGDRITKDSFIFSFKINDDDGSESNILSRVMINHNAIFNGSFNGPTFGDGDLIIFGFSGNCSIRNSYEKQIRRDMHFDIEECEVFEIF
ncbi:carbohydrate-binding module family 13 protein [Rhizophagus irregularis DAOM 181602=DAOM 197198]|nr:carbohydrate-binding module family 13 protein [Rhizophagus irregularis DAOM 181602=DAOM 197198]